MRRTTRMRCQIPVSLISLDPHLNVELQGQVVVANVHGCCFQSPRPLPPGTPVRLQVGNRRAQGHVVNTMPVDEKSCVLGIDLEDAGNIWGIQNPPGDWGPVLAAFPPGLAAAPPPVVAGAEGKVADSSRFEALREEITAQLARLQKVHAEQLTILREEKASARAAREAAENTVAEQLERMRQVREYVESLACSIPTAVKTQAQEQAKTLLQHLQQGDPSDDVSRVMDSFEAKLAAQVTHLGQQLRRELREESEARAASVPEGSLRELQAALQNSAREWSANFKKQAEQAAAELRAAMQKFAAEQSLREAAQPAATPGARETAVSISGLRPQLERFFQERQQQFDTTHQSALAQLQQLESRAETLVSLVDVELQNHGDQMISEVIAQMRQELQKEAAAFAGQYPAPARGEVEGKLMALLQRAEAVRADLERLSQGRPQPATAPASWSGEQLAQVVREAEPALRARVAEIVRREESSLFAARQQEFQAAADAAAARFQELQNSADTLVSMVDLELQKRSDQYVRDAVAEIQQQLQSSAAALRQQHLAQIHASVEGGVSSLLQRAQEAHTGLQTLLESVEQRTGNARQLDAALRSQLEEAQRFLATDIEKTRQTLRDLAAETGREVRGELLAEVRHQNEAWFDARQKAFESAQQAAVSQLQQLQERADSLVSLVDVELQKHAEEGVRDATAEARQTMAREIAAEMTTFREMLHALCAEAGGEIRGRICQAVEDASNSFDKRISALHDEMAELGKKHAGELHGYVELLHQELDAGLRNIRARYQEAQAVADAAMRATAARALESCTAEIERLSHDSAERWRTAVGQSMSAIQQAFSDAAQPPRPAEEKPEPSAPDSGGTPE